MSGWVGVLLFILLFAIVLFLLGLTETIQRPDKDKK